MVELSMVIVAAGLLVGGIFVARGLVHSSKIRSIVKERDVIDKAVLDFKLKYNCLPADCTNWVSLGFAQDGNKYYKGDGIINANEKLFFWESLSTAKFIPHVQSNIFLPNFALSNAGSKGYWDIWSPKDTMAGSAGDGNFSSLPAKNYYWLHGVIKMDSFPYSAAAILIPSDAYAIDAKIDDGLPLKGDVRAAGDNYGNIHGSISEPGSGPWLPAIAKGGVEVDSCVDSSDTPNKYNILNLNRTAANLCSLLVKAEF